MIDPPLVVFNGALGDTVACLPALVALREGCGRLEVRGAAGRLALLEAAGPGFEIASIEGIGWHRLFAGGDAAIDPSIPVAGRVVFVPADPAVVAALRSLGADVRPYRSLPGPDEAIHFSDHFWSELTGRPGPAPPPVLAGRIAGDGPWIVHPGSGRAAKNRSPEELAAVVESLPGPVVVLEGPADRAAVGALEARLGGSVAIAAGLDLPELLALLAPAAGFVGHDSGPSHVAAALGVPTLALFRSTDPVRWAPRGRRVVVGGPEESAVSALERLLLAPEVGAVENRDRVGRPPCP